MFKKKYNSDLLCCDEKYHRVIIYQPKPPEPKCCLPPLQTGRNLTPEAKAAADIFRKLIADKKEKDLKRKQEDDQAKAAWEVMLFK